MCSPLRHSLLHRVDPQTRSVFHDLSELGYRVGLLGKTHISPAVSFPFENRRTDVSLAKESYPITKTHISPAVSFPFENLSSQAKDSDKAAVTDAAFSLC